MQNYSHISWYFLICIFITMGKFFTFLHWVVFLTWHLKHLTELMIWFSGQVLTSFMWGPEMHTHHYNKIFLPQQSFEYFLVPFCSFTWNRYKLSHSAKHNTAEFLKLLCVCVMNLYSKSKYSKLGAKYFQLVI